MSKLGYARMPYIGSQVVDSAGVTLIEEWIRSLPQDTAAPASSPLASDSTDAKALAEVLAQTTSPVRRDEAIGTLLKSTAAALSLVCNLHRPTMPTDIRQAAAKLGAATSTSDVRGLFDTFLPESHRKATLGANIDPQVILGRRGDRERGKLIFFSDGARCRNCHEIDDPGQSVGPSLQEINKKYAQLPDLLQQVLQPSLKIDDPYAAYVLLTTDGRTISGLLAQQNEREIVIKTSEKKLERLARDSISEMQKSPKSLMPDRILSDLTAQEAADLFAYVHSLGPAR
jgi:putative heme-binding domain-containing protein